MGSAMAIPPSKGGAMGSAMGQRYGVRGRSAPFYRPLYCAPLWPPLMYAPAYIMQAGGQAGAKWALL